MSALKAKLSASRSMMSKLLCRGKVFWRNRLRIPASIHQLHYSLFQCRVSSNQHNKIICCVAHAFHVPLPRLCGRRTIQRFRTESGLWSLNCVAKATSCAKKMASSTFSMPKTRDGTHKNGTRIQANGCHFKKGTGKLVGGVIGVALPHNKTIRTQALLTREAEVRLIANGEGLEVSDIKSGVSDGAANEGATNQLVGVPSAMCATHNGCNTGKHGVAPTVTTQWIECVCGEEKAPCKPCTWSHGVLCETYFRDPLLPQPVPPSFVCSRCHSARATPVEDNFAWDKAADKLRQLVKGMSLGYGLGVGGELRDWAFFEGKKILQLPREVGDRFFGVFFSDVCILTMPDTLA